LVLLGSLQFGYLLGFLPHLSIHAGNKCCHYPSDQHKSDEHPVQMERKTLVPCVVMVHPQLRQGDVKEEQPEETRQRNREHNPCPARIEHHCRERHICEEHHTEGVSVAPTQVQQTREEKYIDDDRSARRKLVYSMGRALEKTQSKVRKHPC
jgi:hypothetical protein